MTWLRSDAAQALIEFALVVPLLATMTLGIVLLGQVGAAKVSLANAAVQGARVGALTNDDELVRDAVAAATESLPGDEVDVTIQPLGDEPPRTSDPRGTLLRVEVVYALPFSVLGLNPVVRGSAAHLIEWTP